jgi:hypothetical protein
VSNRFLKKVFLEGSSLILHFFQSIIIISSKAGDSFGKTPLIKEEVIVFLKL